MSGRRKCERRGHLTRNTFLPYLKCLVNTKGESMKKKCNPGLEHVGYAH